ncbi:MAG: hypothetical protein WBL02_09285 [Methanomethylovorans sp.]|uniref:hypothetical protein n=1 Tax=Methanomethylovorans sp. TaxID=2758717 RepID=UPI000AA67F8E|nr:hypothetical protein [Methanomethylovorans sp.]
MYDDGFKNEKIKLHEHIKEIEVILAKKLKDKGVKQEIKLDSYIISETALKDVKSIFHTNSLDEYAKHHIVFNEEKEKYIGKYWTIN